MLGANAAFVITSQWATGYNGQITITNDGASAVNGWVLEFDFTGTITNLWNGSITSHSGSHYIVKDAGYNAALAPGGSTAVGFTADPASPDQPPGNYAFNGSSIATQLAVSTGALPGDTIGAPYSQQLMATGGTPPYSWSLAAGTLPAGLVLSSSGVISGSATAPGVASFTVQVSDASTPSKTATKMLSITAAAMPSVSVGDVGVVLTPGPSGFLSTSGNQLVDAAGLPVRITGINWFGFDTGNKVLHGLWTRGYKEAFDQIKALGFNAVRIPFCSEMLKVGAVTNSIDFSKNPDLSGLSPLEVLDKVVDYCGSIGLRIILDRHSAKADGYLSEDVWYIAGDAYYTEQRWISDWVMLATRYAGNPTIIGADLFNEPKRTATWGNSTPATDWNKAAERCGNAILAANPNWLIIVEGVEKFAGSGYWWGGNLQGVANFPVTLSAANKLVYSMHDYPGSVAAQPWFSASNYPQNLAGVWDTNWGYVFKGGVAPLLLGEFGTKLITTSDQQWLDKLTDYVDGDFNLDGTRDLSAAAKGISWTWWCFNPNSGDTGGILNDDWITVNTAKLAYIQPSMAPLLGMSGSAQSVSFVVSLSAASTQSVTIAWSTIDGTAQAGSDYTAASGTLTFAPGETTKTINITLLPAVAPTGTKSFSLKVSNPSNGVIAKDTGVAALISNSTPWERWQSARFTPAELVNPAISGERADPDENGVCNLLEYATSTDSMLPTMSIVGGRLTLSFSRNASATDTTLIVRGGDSPVGPWTDLAQSQGGAPMVPLVNGVAVSETGSGDAIQVEVRDASTVTDPDHPNRFLTLQAQR